MTDGFGGTGPSGKLDERTVVTPSRRVSFSDGIPRDVRRLRVAAPGGTILLEQQT